MYTMCRLLLRVWAVVILLDPFLLGQLHVWLLEYFWWSVQTQFFWGRCCCCCLVVFVLVTFSLPSPFLCVFFGWFESCCGYC